MTGHRPFSELSERLQRRLADRDAERQRIWAAIQSWEECALTLDEECDPGIKFRPLAPFFDELHAIVFPDEYLTDDEISAGGASTREAVGVASSAMSDATHDFLRPPADHDEMRSEPSVCPACSAEVTVWAWRDDMGIGYQPVARPQLRLVETGSPDEKDQHEQPEGQTSS